jgi:uncharacterized membrane protein YccC
MTAAVSNTRAYEPQRAKAAVPIVSAESDTLAALVFAVKTFLAALLALFVSFWLDLDEPYWALLTVFVVAQPDSGLVLAKGFYRIVGTAAGLLFTMALVFAFAQYGKLFIASLAVWIGVCNFAARAVRNFASYGFQLAGYTVAIVGIPAALNPNEAYPVIVARATEISLGIGCMALVSRLIGPRELAPKLVALVRELMRRVDRFAEVAMNTAAAREQLAAERATLAKDFGAVEAMRSSAYFESADVRVLNEPLRRATYAAVDLYAAAEGAAAHLGTAAHATRPQDAGASITNTNDTPRENAEVISALLSAADTRAVASARKQLGEAEIALDRGKRVAGPGPAPRLWSDPVAAALTGVRCALAVAITAAFWFATAWPSGPTAVIVAGVLCTLLASMKQPEKLTLASAVTTLVAAVPVYVTQFHLLPYALDFASMAAVLAPLLLGCAFIIAQPGIGPLGLLAAIYFAIASHIDNNSNMTYNVVNFLNTSLALLVGIGVALVMFAVFFPETPERVGRRFRRQFSVQLSHLAAARHPSAQAFDVALCEWLVTTLARVKDEPALARKCLESGVTALSSGHAIGRLRAAISSDRLAPGIAAEVSSLLGRISRAYLHPSRAGLLKSAWEARTLRQRSLATARAAKDPEQIDALADVLAGCEALRSGLVKALVHLQEMSDVR